MYLLARAFKTHREVQRAAERPFGSLPSCNAKQYYTALHTLRLLSYSGQRDYEGLSKNDGERRGEEKGGGCLDKHKMLQSCLLQP